MAIKNLRRVEKELVERTNHIIEKINSKREIYLVISLILYKIVLELFYVIVISPRYAYEGLVYHGRAWKYIFSWLIYAYMIFILPKQQEGIKECFLHVQFAVTVAPMVVFYALADKSTSYLLMTIIVISIETFILCRKEKIHIGINVRGLQSYMTVFMFAFAFGIYLTILLYGGFYGVKSFDLNYLYEIRKVAYYPRILGYFIGWLTSAVIPFYILYFLNKKKYIFSIMLIGLSLLLYMTVGNKNIYLSLFVILSVYVVTHLKVLILGMYIGIAGICSTLMGMFIIEEKVGLSIFTIIGSSLVGERFLFIPALNKFLYYECFSEFPKVGFSDGMIGKFFGLTYPYNGSMGQTVYAYLNNGHLFESNSNTGYLGDSYGQAGFWGMLIIGVLLAFFVKLLCNIGQNMDKGIMCSLLVLLAVILNDGAFITIFLTSGWIILLLLMIVYAEPKGRIYERRNL